MSARLEIELRRTAEYIRRFNLNTRKSKGRYDCVEALQMRMEKLDLAWKEYEEALKKWQNAADEEEVAAAENQDEYTRAFDANDLETTEEAYEDARLELIKLRKVVTGDVFKQQHLPSSAAQAQPGAPASNAEISVASGSAGFLSAGSAHGIGGAFPAVQEPGLNHLPGAALPPAQGAMNQGAMNIVQPSLRLPVLQPPNFNGELENWIGFRDVFSAIVINNQQLSDVHRLHLLRAACSNSAAEAIAGIAMMEGNFETAWQTLVRKFDNERLLVFRLVEKMLKLPAMKKECPIELGLILNGTNQSIRALRVLQRPTEQLDDILVVMTVTKLDLATRTLWERELGANKNMPTFAQLDEFLHGILGSMEAMRDWNGGGGSSGGGGTSGISARNNFAARRTAHTHTVAAVGGGKRCDLCQGQHGIYNCQQFLARSVADRRAFVGEHKLCFRCISTNKHRAQVCNSRFSCRACGQNHHSLLHIEENVGTRAGAAADSSGGNAEQSSSAAVAGSRRSNPFDGTVRSSNMCTAASRRETLETLLPTAWVLVTSEDGRTSRLRALIDQGSQVSLISRNAVQKLGLRWQATNISITGVAESSGKTYGCVKFSAAACHDNEKEINICALVLSTITADLPTVSLPRSTHPVISKLQLADDSYWQTGRIDVLLGAAVVAEILGNGVLKADGILAQETLFGWILSGSAGTRARVSATVACTSLQLDGLLQRFWEQEEGSHKPIMSVEDERCEAIYASTTSRAGDGRYVVELPFRQGGRELGESYNGAVRRLLQMEKKFVLYPELQTGYRSFMEKYLSLGHMEKIQENEVNVRPHCYLPHHAVFKPDSTTTKLRVVFDATAATANGVGLNSLLYTGPQLQEKLTCILMRWRGNRICFSADIEKMYRQILVKRDHQEFQRIVWRDSSTNPIGHYRLKTVTYGTASAPYMAVKTLQRLADDEAGQFPCAAQVVRNDFYVDDCLSGAHSVGEAIRIKDELLKLMAAGGMRLLKWSSNCRELLETLPDGYVECKGPLIIDDDESIKALGVRWHPTSDEFAYIVNKAEISAATTKRKMLSEIARLFDPLGLLAPVIITAKTIMQNLWLTAVGWDDELPQEVVDKWRTFQLELPAVEKIRVRRWFGVGTETTVQLHGFSDASMLAYAACVYVRAQNPDGTVTVTLLAAKSKVAPIKQQSVPRLELNGAVMLARLLVTCRQALRCDEAVVHAWTDSTVVLAWLKRHANVWQTFVANRVSEIQSTMNATQWNHVPGVENPADVASRGIMPSEMRDHALWWSGPRWLSQEQEQWPQPKEHAVDESALEEKKKVAVNVTMKTDMFELAYRFSCWRRLLRITAYCRRALPKNRRAERWLLAEEVENARINWLLLIQAFEFGDVAKLVGDEALMRKNGWRKLCPFVDKAGLLRVGGRLSNKNCTYDEQHPVIIPGKNKVVELIILDAHERTCHGGPQATSGYLHQRYWLLQERRNVRACVHRCVTCVKTRPRMQSQLMGSLPEVRVQQSFAFANTAIDYAGPIQTRTSRGRGQKSYKSWVAVFVCMSTKAVHLELVSELTTAAFLAAFKRFTSRRGHCSNVYCDNGTNFVGGDRELREEMRKAMQDENWRAMLANGGTQFNFSPPGSPHFNGLAEATVRMAKTAMRRIIGNTTLTFEEMTTFLTQIEAALNSRPLAVLSADSDDANALTPGHFLAGKALNAVPEANIVDVNVSPMQRWRLVQQMVQHFWQRWNREYVHHLQERKKWQTVKSDVQVNDVVVIQDEAKHNTHWKLGRVTETHPGADGHVRVVTLKTANGLIKRAVTKVCVLPVHDAAQ